LISRVIHCERCTACGCYTKTFQEWLGAMCSGTDCYPCPVNNHRYVMRMDPFQLKRDNGSLAFGITENTQRVDLPKPVMGVITQIFFMRQDGMTSDPFDIFD